ncbi:MAG: flagellar hook-length control protein FliK [Eubacteriales bacterium]
METTIIMETMNLKSSPHKGSKSTKVEDEKEFSNVMKNCREETTTEEEKKLVANKKNSTKKTIKVSIKKDLQVKVKEEDAQEEIIISPEEIEKKLVQIITEQLGITPEMLTNILEQLNLNVEELLIPENLQQLTQEFFQVNNLFEALMDDTYAPIVKELFHKVDELRNIIMEQQERNTLLDESLNTKLEDLDDAQDNMGKQTEMTDLKDEPSIIDKQVNSEQVVKQDEKLIEVNILENNEKTSIFETELSKHQTNSEKKDKNSAQQGLDFDSFINELTQKIDESSFEKVADNNKASEYEVIIKQLVEQIKIQMKPDTTKMEFQLKPEHLGKLQLSIASKEGVISAQFVVESQSVKETLENQMVFLKDNLNEQGIKVDKVEIIIASEQYNESKDQNNTKEHKQNKKSSKIANIFEQSSEEEVEEEDYLINEDSVINFTA